MKIAHIIPRHLGLMGGLQIFVHNIAKEQVKNGHDVYVLTHSYPGKSSDYPYRIIKQTAERVFYFFYFNKLVAEIYLSFLQKNKNSIYGKLMGLSIWSYACRFFKKQYTNSLRCSGDDIQISYEYEYGVKETLN